MVNTAGGKLISSAGQITGNIGELAITKISNVNNSITQGFLQAESVTNRLETLKMDQSIIYPNPTNDLIYFKQKDKIEKLDVIITDIFGRIVLKEALTINGISLGNLPAGLYQVIIINSNKNIINKTSISKIN